MKKIQSPMIRIHGSHAMICVNQLMGGSRASTATPRSCIARTMSGSSNGSTVWNSL